MKFPFTIPRQKLSVMTFKLVTLHNFLRDIIELSRIVENPSESYARILNRLLRLDGKNFRRLGAVYVSYRILFDSCSIRVVVIDAKPATTKNLAKEEREVEEGKGGEKRADAMPGINERVLISKKMLPRFIINIRISNSPDARFIAFSTQYPPFISRENWKGWRSHECAVEFRELLNEPSSRKPLITKGLSEESADRKREADIRESLFAALLPPPLLRQEEKAETEGKPENKKGERVKGGLERLDPGGSYSPGGKRDEGGALRLHSSANRGIFVRFLFENKTLPTTPDANKKGDEGGMRALSGLVSYMIRSRGLKAERDTLNLSIARIRDTCEQLPTVIRNPQIRYDKKSSRPVKGSGLGEMLQTRGLTVSRKDAAKCWNAVRCIMYVQNVEQQFIFEAMVTPNVPARL
ncbi:hypothetical protein EAG_09759 [Camponotus floridanus]|uniref:Uncharacterized protein n=1 Tax=Camponotus floridanus TaxID=104421 RepID=E2ANP5_CAMFO|nr:hypothetical protein EAG_09759 [Camponotus floridanus]